MESGPVPEPERPFAIPHRAEPALRDSGDVGAVAIEVAAVGEVQDHEVAPRSEDSRCLFEVARRYFVRQWGEVQGEIEKEIKRREALA